MDWTFFAIAIGFPVLFAFAYGLAMVLMQRRWARQIHAWTAKQHLVGTMTPRTTYAPPARELKDRAA